MAESLEDQLDRVQQAIAKVETTGEEVWYDGKRIKRSEISQLYEREKYLLRKINRQSGGKSGIRVRGGVPT